MTKDYKKRVTYWLQKDYKDYKRDDKRDYKKLQKRLQKTH